MSGFNMSKEQTDLLPCPLCNVALTRDGKSPLGDIWSHPLNGCAMQVSWFTATPEWVEKWNRRASPSPAGGVQAVTDEWPGQNYETYERVHNVAIAAYEAATPADYRYSASALRRAVDAAIRALSSQAQTTGGAQQ